MLCVFMGLTSPVIHSENQPSHHSCQTIFAQDDPRLFQFLETRETVDFAQYENQPITGIAYRVLPIFNENDPKEDNWFYRTINFLHIDTRDNTLKKQLSFEEGDRLAKDRILESERLLRDNEYLIDAMILPYRLCEDGIELLVVARDIWTLTPSASFARAGGENETDVGVTEKNLLGRGQEIALGRFRTEDRSGYSIAYRNEQLFGNNSSLRITYSDNSDGEVKSLSLRRPFYTLDTRWSAGISANDETLIEDIEALDQTLNTYRHDIKLYEGFYGWSAGLRDGGSRRWTLGLTDSRDTFTQLDPTTPPPPADRRLRYPWLSYESIEDRYWTTTNISQIQRHEDILLGTRWRLVAGYASEQLDSTENAVIFNLSNRLTNSIGEHHLLQLHTYSSGRLNTDTGNLVSSFLGAAASYHYFIDPQNRWFGHLQLDAGKNLNQDEQLTTSGDENLRGYPNDVQRGNRRWLLTIERRHFTNWHPFRLLRFGGAVYLDAGRTWDTETPDAPDTSTLANAGIGLRISSTKARTDKVLHLDIATPLLERQDIDRYQVIVSGKTEF